MNNCLDRDEAPVLALVHRFHPDTSSLANNVCSFPEAVRGKLRIDVRNAQLEHFFLRVTQQLCRELIGI